VVPELDISTSRGKEKNGFVEIFRTKTPLYRLKKESKKPSLVKNVAREQNCKNKNQEKTPEQAGTV
jgi:competence protein ComGC